MVGVISLVLYLSEKDTMDVWCNDELMEVTVSLMLKLVKTELKKQPHYTPTFKVN
jgi:hypothetical protein